MICMMLINHDLFLCIVFVLLVYYQHVRAILRLHLVLYAYNYKAIMCIYSLSLRIDAQHIGKECALNRGTLVWMSICSELHGKEKLENF